MNQPQFTLDLLFETSWEVCNKIGGIYTVLSTKAKTLQKLAKDKTIFIGPDVWSETNPSPYFIESAGLLKGWLKKSKLPYGITARVGRWDIPGKPIAVLVKFDGMYSVKDEFYGKMWELFHVSSMEAYGDYDEGCAFAHAAGIVIGDIYRHLGLDNDESRVVAHFDEWTTGMGLLYVEWKLPHIATIFTTHATSIGRSICGNGKHLYDYLNGYDGDQMARELNMVSKHSLEKAAAHQADCFTTVSEITATECEQLLQLRPHVVTPNGFELNFVPPKTRRASARQAARKKMLSVAEALTGCKHEDKNTFIVVTSGRCEYRNKGIDVFIDAIKTLETTAEELDGRRVLAYVMVPAWCGGPREDVANSLKHRDSKRLNDPIITHIINNPSEDPIYNRIRSLGFTNDSTATVEIIYVPCYLDGRDGIFDMTYYDILPGVDATIFPSYYEPWGYTPLESIAFGVPTVTTSLSGFGQWIMLNRENTFDECGVNVIGRNDSNYHGVVDSISRSIRYLLGADNDTLASISTAAVNTAQEAQWSNFISYYLKSFDIAMDRNQSQRKINQK
ncbi:MAG: glycogen/starch synthase [Muribaculaceae bacterium]|nr:glycogen/starch synthase [Muribaculaceae bacterium]